MTGAAIRTVYPCEEFGEVAVPIRDLLEGGELQIYPEVAGRGLFDIDYRKGSLVLKASRYVGLIPITDRVAIHVRPRVTIANLLYLLWRAGGSPTRLTGFARGYDLHSERIDSPEELYLDTFLTALRNVRSQGILKKYRSRESTDVVRGRFLASKSITQSFAKGYKHRPRFEVYDFGIDCPESQILKATAEHLLRHCRSDPSERGQAASRELSHLLNEFAAVNTVNVHPAMIARTVPSLIRSLPAKHQGYEAPLWLAMLLAMGAVVSLESVGGTRFETLVIDVSGVFERYVRRVCQDADDPTLQALKFVDGNQHPVELFTSGARVTTQPDIYVLRGDQALAVLDVKYKPHPSTQDRYELLAFCEALGVKRAAFICPAPADEPLSEHHGTTKSGISIRILRIRLHSTDRSLAETEFLLSLRQFLEEP